jgi:hypothetical protein
MAEGSWPFRNRQLIWNSGNFPHLPKNHQVRCNHSLVWSRGHRWLRTCSACHENRSSRPLANRVNRQQKPDENFMQSLRSNKNEACKHVSGFLRFSYAIEQGFFSDPSQLHKGRLVFPLDGPSKKWIHGAIKIIGKQQFRDRRVSHS